MARCVTPPAGKAERRMAVPWRCDHCGEHLQLVCCTSTDVSAVAQLASDQHERTRTACHAEHGSAGIRFLKTQYPG